MTNASVRQFGVFGARGSHPAQGSRAGPEVIGSAADLWVAHRQGAFSANRMDGINPMGMVAADPRPPFLGWMMLLEDCPASQAPVVVDAPHYPASPEFQGASYARRYQLLAKRLVKEQLYGAAALILSNSGVACIGEARGERRPARRGRNVHRRERQRSHADGARRRRGAVDRPHDRMIV